MKVYIAASSDEIDRAEFWHDTLRARSIRVVSTWPVSVRTVGQANPRRAAKESRAMWSRACLAEASSCDLLWMLVPAKGHGRGAYAEFGAASALGKQLVVSGDYLQSVFTAQAAEFEDDFVAAEHIMSLAALVGTL